MWGKGEFRILYFSESGRCTAWSCCHGWWAGGRCGRFSRPRTMCLTRLGRVWRYKIISLAIIVTNNIKVAHKLVFGNGHLTWEWDEGLRSLILLYLIHLPPALILSNLMVLSF